MKELKEFIIPFVGLKLGEHRFDFKISESFFEYFEYEDFNNSDINLEVLLIKKNTMLEFTLSFKGCVNVNCDVTNEPYDQNITGSFHFIVKFGDEFNDENEELITIPHGSYEFNIQQYVYETIVLAVPTKRTHPGIEAGTLKSDILNKLEELRPTPDGNKTDGEDENIDPRWDKLKNLLTDK
jgi:uncharacterized metal-binding protein YceD (DUF177 family)